MTTIIDYDAGNIHSVVGALSRLGEKYVLSSDPDVILSSDRVLLPGVGEASRCMESLRRKGLDTVVPRIEAPLLGICIGLQLLCTGSEEGNASCLGVFDVPVLQMHPAPGMKVPHMGWNEISAVGSPCPILHGLERGKYFYFVHSFYAPISDSTAASTTHGNLTFSSVLWKDNFFGVQFHPEKSGEGGLELLRNFISL